MFPALHANTSASPLASPAWSSLAWADGGMGVYTRRGWCSQTSIIETATNQVLLVASSVIMFPNYWLWLKAGWRAFLWTSECASASRVPQPFLFAPPFCPTPILSTWDRAVRRIPAQLEMTPSQLDNSVMSHNMKDGLQTDRQNKREGLTEEDRGRIKKKKQTVKERRRTIKAVERT